MATPQYAPTSETTNAGRASQVLLGPCSDMLRDLLRHYIPPSTFSNVVQQQRKKLQNLTKPQQDIIFPRSGLYTGNYNDFDISLLYTLLRNLCNIPKHKNGWGNDPDPNDLSLSANIERIRICRNRLGHAVEFSLSDLEFNDIWSSISTAVIEIDKVLKISHKYEKDIDYLKIATMDSEKAKDFEELIRKQYTEDMEIKFLLSEHKKCSDQKLDDIRSNQEMIVKRLEMCTNAVIHDQQRRNTNMGESYTTQYNTNSEIQPAPRLPFRTVQITPSSITAEWGNCEKWLSDQQRHYILTCTKNSETHSEDSESKTEIIEVNQDVLPVQKCTGTVSELLSNTIYSLKVKAENGNVASRELVMESQTKTKVDALIEPFSSSEEAGLYIRKTYENLITDVLDKIDTDMLAEYLLQMAIISKNSFDDIKGANLLKKNDLIVKNVLAKRNIAERPHENFWEALDFYLPHTKRKLVENARKNEEQITLSSPSLSWNFINDHRDELDVDDILNTAHALFAVGYIKDSEHDDILLSKSPSKKVEALMNIVSEKQNKVLFLQAFEARCNRTQLEGLFERQKKSESAKNSQTVAGLDMSRQDVEETAQSEEVRDMSQQDIEETAQPEEVRDMSQQDIEETAQPEEIRDMSQQDIEETAQPEEVRDIEETAQPEEVRDMSQQDIEETAQPEEVHAQLILTGDEEILSQMFENPNCMKDIKDMIENNVIKVTFFKQNSIVIELSSSSETSYTEFVKILKEGRIDDFIEYLLAKHNISNDSPEGNTKIKLRLSTLPPAEDQSKMKEKILRRSFPHVLHKCLPNIIMEEIKKLKLPSQFRMKLLEGLNKSDNDDNLKKNRFLMTMLLREDTLSEESTRCLMKNLVGSDILDYELKRNTGDILGKIVENYGHILRELHRNIIMKMNEIYAVFGDEVFRSDSKSRQDRSALFLEDVLTKESKVLDLANVLSMLELDSLLHDKESKIGQVKRVQQRGQTYHFFYERQMEIPIANEESRAASKYSPMQETNTERASQILLGPCEDQLRDVLRHLVPPALFHDVITRHRSNLLLTQSQADIILPRTGRYSGDYSDMNISLLYSLLRNISNIPSHNNGWGNTPDISDSSLSACIDRIRMARDTVVHCSRTILFEKEFNDLLNEIKMAVISMDSYLGNSNKYEKAVDFLLTETMDTDQAVFIQQLKKQVEADKTTMRRISNLEKRVHEDISTVHKGVGRLDTELGGLDKNIERLGFSIKKHEKEMTRQVLGKISVQEHHEKIEKLQTDVKRHREEEEERTAKFSRIETEVQEHGIQIQNTSQRFNENLSEHHEKIEKLQTDVKRHREEEEERTTKFSRIETEVQKHGIQIQNISQRLNENLSEHHEKIEKLQTDVKRHREEEEERTTKFHRIETEVQEHGIQIQNIGQRLNENLSDMEPDVNIFREKLIERNNKETREIPLSSVTTDGDTLPIEHLFSSVVIREDVTENRKGKKTAQSEEQQERKEVKSPEDMLTKNGKPVPRVFMLGKAAHGKTTYCKWFLKTWCNTQQPGMSGRPLSKWENALSQFDFVFHVPLYQVDQSRAEVIDMICQDILGSDTDTDLQVTAKHVLSSKKYRCFIMIDGLDEWKPDQSVIDRLKYKGMPNIDNMSNCVIFTTMRPWKFSEVEGVNSEDRVIEILGLDDAGIESVIEKILVHYHEMKPGTAEFEAKYEEITSKLDNETVKSFIKIPLLAVVCVQIWYEGEQVGDSMTSFYIAMVNMLIKRAHLKHDTQKLSFESINVSLPRLLSTKRNIKNYINVLLKLGKVAYEGLLSKEMKLVFQRDDLETEIGERELQFALDVGLISQRDVHSIMEEKVSVHFFHKSVQEFLAAIYIVTHKEVSDLFCKHLCDIKVVMELSNVIIFICGMCPYLGSVISQRVVSVTDSDTEICKYRELPGPGNGNTVEELYKLQISWHRELEYGQTEIPVTDSPVTFHIADVYLWDSDLETVRVTRELLSYHQLDVRSLYLFRVATDGERGITDTIVNDLLRNQHQTRSLTMIHIDGQNTARSVDTIIGPSLRTLDLSHVQIADTNTVPRPILCDCKLLQKLCLEDIILGDRDIGLTPNMTMLQEVRLREVNMTSSGWGRWLQSVVDIHHQFDVELYDTNIDRHTVSTIHSSPYLYVTQDDLKLMFTRIWPPT